MNNVVSTSHPRNIGMQVIPQSAGVEVDTQSLDAEFDAILAEDLEIPIELSAEAATDAARVETNLEIPLIVDGEKAIAQAQENLDEILTVGDENQEDAENALTVTEELDDVPIDIPLAAVDVSELPAEETEQPLDSHNVAEMELSPEAELLLASLAEEISKETSGQPVVKPTDMVESTEIVDLRADTVSTEKVVSSRVDTSEKAAAIDEITPNPETENSAEVTETDLPEEVQLDKQTKAGSAEKKTDVVELPEAKVTQAQQVVATSAETVAHKAPAAREETAAATQKPSQEPKANAKAETPALAPNSEHKPVERVRADRVTTDKVEPVARAEEKQESVIPARHVETVQAQTENRPVAQPLIRNNAQITDNSAARSTQTVVSAVSTSQPQSTPVTTEAQPSSAHRTLDETHFIENLVRHSRLLTRPDGSSEIRLNVKPENLGPITVRLSLKNDHLHASIEVEQQDVRQAVESLVPRIRQTLAADGISLDKFDVASRRQSDPSEQDSQQNSFDRGGNRSTGQSSGTRHDARSGAPRAAVWTPTGAMDFIV